MYIKSLPLVAVFILLSGRPILSQVSEEQPVVPNEPRMQTGILNPLACDSSHRPNWCSGADLGAWINAAVAHLPGNGTTRSGCGVIQLPSQSSLTFKTTIVKPRCTVIDLNQSTILWTGSSAQAVIVADIDTAAPPNLGGIKSGRIFGGTGITISTATGIFLGGDPTGIIFPYAGGANNQSFYDLDVQNFADDYAVGNNAYQNTWVGGTIALSGRAGIHFVAKGYNEGENFSFHGTTFLRNLTHDILVDKTAFAEINAEAASFDYAGRDSISSTGSLFLHSSDTHFERAPGGKFIDCSSCSVNVSGGAMYLMGDSTSDDAFGFFEGHGTRASFIGVDWANIGNSPISQFFVWKDTSATGSLYMLDYRRSLGQLAIDKVRAYSGSAPALFFDSRALTSNRVLTDQTAVGASRLASGTDLDAVTQCGLYDAAEAVHGPSAFGNAFFHFQVICSNDPRYQHQIAYDMVGRTNRIFIRHEAAGQWSSWAEEISPDNVGNQGFGGNVILPATLTGYHGSGGLKVQMSDGNGSADEQAVFGSDGSVTNSKGGAAGHATCWKEVGKLGYCSSAVNPDGTCTCK